MRNAAPLSPNWLLAAMVASGAWFGLASGPSGHDARGGGRSPMHMVGLSPATGWAARTFEPVRAAGCAAGLILLLIWGMRVLASGVAQPTQSPVAHRSRFTHVIARTRWLRSLRRGGRYGP